MTSQPDRAARAGAVTGVALAVADPPRVDAFLSGVLDRPPGAGAPPLQLIQRDGSARTSGVVVTFGVPDLPAAVACVTAQGGRAEPVSASRWVCIDDQGSRFGLSANVDPDDDAPGVVAYFTLGVADLNRAAHFYGALFGWGFHAVHDGAGLAIEGADVAGGPGGALWNSPVPGSVVTFAVCDIVASARAILSRGGTVTRLERRPYGVALDNCTDGSAIRFHLLQFLR